MENAIILQHPRRASQEQHYRWEIALRRPLAQRLLLAAEGMTAGEQMFFLGAPLGHVVEYERHLRAQRLSRPARELGRLSRLAAAAAIA